MKPDWMEVAIGRKPLKVPMVGDEETTRRLAEQVTARMDAIEEREGRVDSFEAALRAALAYAAELEQTRQALGEERAGHERERDEETRELLKAVTQIANRLRNLVEKARNPRPPEPPELLEPPPGVT